MICFLKFARSQLKKKSEVLNIRNDREIDTMSESIDICIDQIKKRKDLNNEQIHKGVSSKILQK